ncbi:LOW QUALITY PROTEIN: uncharacterized protein LOC103706052 [Phoenix dactylifera]|uniref:LOW QUALITY PROTEIN: uncharacterized protein LOC103706052 n=1 Tax=Phoenix dactylifera TaxID=42345 RepID=A0A8B8J3T6_PHODC|nr:LOW QUALITY PROTEIN: uncharacterized protein LOC103706052 [Phoenix dactylifera]
MVQLFLQKLALDEGGDKTAVKERLSLLQKLESIIWSVLTSEGRYEARLWLCNTISCIHTITPQDQHDLFMDLLRSSLSKHDVAAQLLQMIFEKRPEKAGHVIAKKCYMLEKFFEGNPRHVLQWFDNFAGASESGHTKGARAISQFAFVNRDICWEELEWKGKHGQSPAVVATKPHYFQDLDVLQTVENFLEYVPDFWSSDELVESVKDGEILQIDKKYFVDQFVQMMYRENCEDIWAVIEEFLMEEQFSYLSQHLLIQLDECMLLTFLKSLSKYVCQNMQCKDFAYPSCWLENLLSACDSNISLDEILLLNAVIVRGRQLLRLMGDEEHGDERGKMEELLQAASAFSDADHWALMKECIQMKQLAAVKWIGLQSWVLYYCLSKECKTPQAWELLFIRNGITFRKADDYSLLRSGEFSEGFDSDGGDMDSSRGGHKKRRRERKKRKKYGKDESILDELVEFEPSNGWLGLHLGGRRWLLSTDGFSCVWNMVDIPEHLSAHCFRTWMKWVCSKWRL